jgi:hypothetical protein
MPDFPHSNTSTTFSRKENMASVWNTDHLVHNSFSISALPNEILGLVFERGRPQRRRRHSKTGLPFEVDISHVSRRWRDVAISLPNLWTNIHIFADYSSAWVPMYLERSKSCPLDLRINFWDADVRLGDDSRAREAMVISVLSLILPHTERWGAFILEGYYEESIYMALARLHKVAVPLLQRIAVDFEEGTEYREGTNFPLQIFLGGAPRLSSVRLDMLRCCWPPLSVLTSLDLRQVHRSAGVYSRFLETLKTLPSLAKLCVHGSVVYEETWRLDRYPSIQLPTLRFLRLIRPLHLASVLLIAVTAPHLESLWLQDVHDNDLHTFFESPQVSFKFPALRSLILKSVEFDETTFRNLSRHFPTISRLTTVSSYNLDTLFRIIGDLQPGTHHPTSSNPSVWPALRTIAVRSVEAHGGHVDLICEVLCRMVAARIVKRRRIHKLLLDGEILFKMNQMERLTERVIVEECQEDDEGGSDDEF